MSDLETYLNTEYATGVTHRAWRERAKYLLTTSLVPVERKKADNISQAGRPMRLHLGCADTYLDNWVNIDLMRPGRRLDLRWDLRRGLPFSESTVSAIFSEHFFEHITFSNALALLRECHRVLIPDGIFRLGVPDLGRYLHAYNDSDQIINNVRPGRPTPAMAINEIFYFYSHRAMYDAQTLTLLLEAAGFHSAAVSEFGTGRIAPSPDSKSRENETLYMEALANKSDASG